MHTNPLDRFRLDGRRALITGSTMGIGLAIAEAFAGAGARQVILNSEAQNDAVETALSAVRTAGPRTQSGYLCQDLSQSRGGAALAAAALEATGGEGVDILVLCAGVQIEKDWLDISPEDFQIQVAVNLQSSLELLQGLAPKMRERRYGRIIIISSVQADRPGGNMLVYAATKAALKNITRNLARLLGPEGITVNSIAPGVFDTPRNAHFIGTPEEMAKVGRRVPVGRVGEPVDCAGVALLLASEAGSYISGADYHVDGASGA